MKTIKIPVDERYKDTTPKITNKMKAACHGEFSWEEDAPYYDEYGDVIEHTATREVPWDLCKDIYKAMALIANSEVQMAQVKQDDRFR